MVTHSLAENRLCVGFVLVDEGTRAITYENGDVGSKELSGHHATIE